MSLVKLSQERLEMSDGKLELTNGTILDKDSLLEIIEELSGDEYIVVRLTGSGHPVALIILWPWEFEPVT